MNLEKLAEDLSKTLNELQYYDFIHDLNIKAKVDKNHDYSKFDLEVIIKDSCLLNELIAVLSDNDKQSHMEYLSSISLLSSNILDQIKNNYLPKLKKIEYKEKVEKYIEDIR